MNHEHPFDAWEQGEQWEGPPAPNPLQPWAIDWATFWETDHTAEDFLAAPLLANGRGHAIYAAAKTGKSLLILELAAAIATGKQYLHRPAGDPQHVLYIDYEMTPDDVSERLETFGYGPNDNMERLHYIQMPSIPPLDTPEGGLAVITAADAWDASLIIVDTTARAAQGDENAAETYRDMYRHTLMPLKSAGRTTVRVDHAGKDGSKGQRGSSAKNDDVDIVWRLTVNGDVGEEQAVKVAATHRRMGWIPEEVSIIRRPAGTEPMHVMASGSTHAPYIEGTKECAADLIGLGVAIGTSSRKATTALQEVGKGRQRQIILDALRYMREQAVDNPPVVPVDNPETGLEQKDTKDTETPVGTTSEPDTCSETGTTFGTTGNHLKTPPLTSTNTREPLSEPPGTTFPGEVGTGGVTDKEPPGTTPNPHDGKPLF